MAEEMFAAQEKKKLGDLTVTDATCRVETEIILPDYKEEAERIVRGVPKAVIKNKQVYLRDRYLICEIEGSVGFHILYRTSGKGGEGKVSSFLQTENFSHTFQIPFSSEEFTAEDVAVFAEATCHSTLVKLIGPRKLSAKCEVVIALDIKCNQGILLFSDETSRDLVTRSKEVKATCLRVQQREEMSFSQTISLPKAYLPIEELCEMEVVPFVQNVKVEDGGLSFLGLCDLHCSYTAAGENTFISFYQPIEFERRVAIADLMREDICRVNLTPVALKASTDINEEGENKNILFELTLLCETNAFETETLFVTEDAFSTDCELAVEKKTEQVQELLGVFDFSDSIKAQLPSKHSSLLRAEGIQAGVEFRNSYLEEGRLCLEGKLVFSYLGITESDEMKHTEETYEFKSYVTPPFSIPEGEECSIEVCGGARGIDVDPDGEILRLRFDLCGSICVYVIHRPEVVCRLERGETISKKQGEILYVYPHRGEDLWSLAKEYHISPEKVKKQNHLTGENLPSYLKLIP